MLFFMIFCLNGQKDTGRNARASWYPKLVGSFELYKTGGVDLDWGERGSRVWRGSGGYISYVLPCCDRNAWPKQT